MNHIYRVVYNTASQTYQAVPEISKGKHKSCAEKTSAAASKTSTFAGKLRALCAALLALTCPFALAAPTGGAVSAGQAAIHQAGNITDIRQSSQNAAINWQNFSIGAHETVNFHQPNAQSLTLNRVIGNERSFIDGAMNANGKVFISNPNGMLIGRDAQINVGSLVATTAGISDEDFMNGRYQFTNAKGEIENLGNITVPQGGVVALIAPIVKHSGTITAPKAHTLLASADSFSITLPDNANFAYTLDKGTLQGLVDNGGAILADGGRVVLTAKGVDSVKKSLIKHTGVIEANTVQNKNGVIELLGDLDNSALNVSGSLKAEGKGADKGGFVETSASQVKIHDSAVVSTKSEQGQTGTWLIDPKDLIIANSGGDMTATQVENALKSNNIALHTIRNTQGKNDGKGDIKINDAISWNANTLTLNAENDIHINANLNGSGTAKLALEYGQGTSDGGNSDYHIKRGVKVNLPMGNTLTTQKGKNGEKIEFTVIHQMPDIIKNADGDWESKFTTRNIAFGADIDVSHTKNHEGFAGWRLSDDNQDITVAGLGHKADGLYLRSKKDSQYTGLFNVLYHVNRKNYRDVGVTNADVASEGRHAYAGALVGIGGNIKNSYATGRVATSGYEAYVGGLVGKIDYGNKLDDSYTNVSVSSTGENAHTGGLVGDGSNISNSYATGDVSSQGRGVDAGGLVGFGYDISNSYATGNVSSQGYGTETGGLVGNGKDISNSYAIGNVSSQGYAAGAGGLVGIGENISNSYATGNVSSQGDRADTGGLAGHGHNISNSYATGDVSSAGVSAHAGGLAGFGYDISNSYATGDVSSQEHDANAGGLVGSGYHISNSYATGDVSSQGRDADAGGLVGNGSSISNSYANNTSIKATGKDSAMGGLIGNYDYNARHDTGSKDSFFNQDKHPTLPAIGKYKYYVDKSKIVNVTGKTEAELKQKSTFTDAGWDFEKVWYMNKNADGTYSYPMLRAFAQTLTVNPTPTPPTAQTTAGVKAPDLSKTYDGKAVNTVDDLKKLNGWKDNFDADGLTTGDSVKSIFKAGTLTIDETKGDWKGAKDVKDGGYSLYPTGTLKDEYQQKYIIEWNKGTLTINKKPISIIGNKTYDGTNYAIAKDFVKNANEKDKVSLLGVENQDDVKVHINTNIKDAGHLSGKGVGTHSLTNLGTLKLDGKVHINTNIKDAGYLSGKDVGTHSLTNLGTLKLDGKDSKNYKLSLAGSYWTINKAPLKVKALNNFVDISQNGVSLLDQNLRDNIGIVSNGLIGDEKIDVSKLKIKIEKNGDSDKNRLGYTYSVSPIAESINLTSGKISNYDITIENGKIYTLPKIKNSFYDFPNGDDDTKQVEKLISYANDLNSVKDEFLAAQVVYNEDFGKNELQELNKLGVTDLIHLDNANGVDDLQMALYQKANSNSYIISYRGTASAEDWIKSNAVTVFARPESYRDSARITSYWISKIQKDNPNAEIIFTGHSLGGSLAQYNSAIEGKNRKVIAFNSAPLRSILINEIESKANCKNISDCSLNAKNFKFDNDILRNIESPFVYKKQLLGEVKDFRLFTTGALNDHLKEHMNDVYKVSTAIKENSDYINTAIYQPAKMSKFSHLDLSAVIPVGRLETVGATIFKYVFIVLPETGATIGATIVGAENQEKLRKWGGDVYEIIHTTPNDLRDLMGKYYKDIPTNDNSLKEYLLWRIINDKYDYEFQGHTLTASKRATDQMRMAYIMYQLGIINDGDAQSLFYLIKDNYKQALARKYSNTKDGYAKQGIQKTIKSWESLTFEIWKHRAGNFIGNDITGDWK